MLAEEEVDAVRIMTVHAAKGLEFDIVAFADAGRDPNLQVPDLLAPADGRLAFRIPSPAGTLGRAAALGPAARGRGARTSSPRGAASSTSR